MTTHQRTQHLRQLLQTFCVADSKFLDATRRNENFQDFNTASEPRRVALLAFAGAAKDLLPSVLDRFDELEAEHKKLNSEIFDLVGRLQRFEEDAQ